MFYKNISIATKTFHGVTLKPGEIKNVPGYINDKGFVRCEAPKAPVKSSAKPSVEATKPATQSTKSTKIEKKEESVNGEDSDQ